MCKPEDVETVYAACVRALDLEHGRLGDEYFYQSLPLCVIDAVFSVGVRYKGTQNVIGQYCRFFGLQKTRDPRDRLPQIDCQEPLSKFLAKRDEFGVNCFQDNIFNNRQRTSSVNGILKAEAVFLFAEVLRNYGVEYFQDVERIAHNEAFARDIKALPGQTKEGACLQYFLMLSGSEEFIAFNRMIERFLCDCLRRALSAVEGEILLAETTKRIGYHYPHMTPRLLDHLIWGYQRAKEKGK